MNGIGGIGRIFMANSILVLISLVICNGMAANTSGIEASMLAGQDLHLTAPVMNFCSEAEPDWKHAIILEMGATIQIGDNLMTADRGVVWLEPQMGDEFIHQKGAFLARAYLEGAVSVKKGRKAKTTAMKEMVDGAEMMVTQFIVTGQVFSTSDSQSSLSPSEIMTNELYKRARESALNISAFPEIPESAQVPEAASVIAAKGKPSKSSGAKAPSLTVEQVVMQYPVHVSAVWSPAPEVRRTVMPDGQSVITASGRLYLFQKRGENQILEFMTDNVVLFFAPGDFEVGQEGQQGNQIGVGKIQSAYLQGNIVMTENKRTTRAEEIYYDFTNNRALVVNGSMRIYDDKRDLPIYVRAEQLGRVTKDIFEARNVQITSSEFYFPQISLNASRMVLLTGETLRYYHQQIDEADEASKYEGQLYDVTAKYGDLTFFAWPKIRTNFKRPDVPLTNIKLGNDSEFGTTIETRWQLMRLLGMKDPAWLESRLALDYFSDRGVGGGVEMEYETSENMGSLVGYVMTDRGEDRLGRADDRRNLDPGEDVRGRFSFRHRQYLPDDWQLTLETSYITDENFLELMYRNEFNIGKSQETLAHLKRIRDNWGFSLLTKARINDFQRETEELPTVEYHLTGQSLWGHRLTFYSDSQVSRFRERFPNTSGTPDSGFYSFAGTRNELDWPLLWNTFKIVPYIAGSIAYDDYYAYSYNLDGSSTTPESSVFLGEAGVRAATMFWKADPHVRSRLWDLNGLRHVIAPYVNAVKYEASESSFEMRDAVHVGLSQRWQTHRGQTNVRTLDWIRWDLEATWLSDNADDSISSAQLYGPAMFVYNDPSIPYVIRRNQWYYNQVRDTLNSDFVWRVSDTMSVLSDMNMDMNSGQLQQFNIGVSRYIHPDISYYVGTRYLRPNIVDETVEGQAIHEEGSNSFVAAITYRISPRYIASFSQEYNFEFRENVRTELSLIRQYHRLFYAVSASVDESMDRTAIMFSIWPQGIDELAIGSRRQAGLTGSKWED